MDFMLYFVTFMLGGFAGIVLMCFAHASAASDRHGKCQCPDCTHSQCGLTGTERKLYSGLPES